MSIKEALDTLEKKLSSVTTLRKHVRLSYARAVYTAVTVAGTKVNDVRYWMFCQKGKGNENLPPTSDSLQQHIKRGNYQAYVWKKALEATQNLPSPKGLGWKILVDALQPVLMTKEPAPRGLPEPTVCHCKKSKCRRADCACRTNSIQYTEACACLAGESCQNPSNTRQITDDEDTD